MVFYPRFCGLANVAQYGHLKNGSVPCSLLFGSKQSDCKGIKRYMYTLYILYNRPSIPPPPKSDVIFLFKTHVRAKYVRPLECKMKGVFCFSSNNSLLPCHMCHIASSSIKSFAPLQASTKLPACYFQCKI